MNYTCKMQIGRAPASVLVRYIYPTLLTVHPRAQILVYNAIPGFP